MDGTIAQFILSGAIWVATEISHSQHKREVNTEIMKAKQATACQAQLYRKGILNLLLGKRWQACLCGSSFKSSGREGKFPCTVVLSSENFAENNKRKLGVGVGYGIRNMIRFQR